MSKSFNELLLGSVKPFNVFKNEAMSIGVTMMLYNRSIPGDGFKNNATKSCLDIVEHSSDRVDRQ